MNGTTDKQTHQIQLFMRKEMTVNGVREVESFDENGAVLQTTAGEMTVEGEDIHVGVLDMDRGLVTLSGRIDAILYSDIHSEEKGGFFRKRSR
ncbi:MAG: YabP/YqfC family sporulation protein [Clostridia bacterium]|nr:YabP/YqfC family sporulation protein [Clostridia bacterium]